MAVAGISKPMVMHLEQGLVARVPNRVLEVLRPDPFSRRELDIQYQQWIRDTRTKNKPYLDAGIADFLCPGCVAYGDWVYLRSSISKSKAGFTKLYCLHPQILDTFESSVGSRIAFTPGMRSFLKGTGIDMDVVIQMEFALSRFNQLSF